MFFIFLLCSSAVFSSALSVRDITSKVGVIMSQGDVNIGQSPGIKLTSTMPRIAHDYQETEALKQLKEHFLKDQTSLCVLSGMPGLGKTALATKYVHDVSKDFNIVYWINGVKKTNIIDSFRLIIKKIEMLEGRTLSPSSGSMQSDEEIIEIAHSLIQAYRWLIVLDNVPSSYESTSSEEYIQSVMPTVNGHVLITSQSTNWSTFPHIELKVFEKEQAINYLVTSPLSSEERQQAALLADELGNFPLALSYCLAYIKSEKMTISAYRQRSMGNHDALLLFEPSSHEASILNIFRLIKENLSKKAIELLNILSFLPADRIPVSIFEDFKSEMKELSGYSLIRYSSDFSYLFIHEILQRVNQNISCESEVKKRILSIFNQRINKKNDENFHHLSDDQLNRINEEVLFILSNNEGQCSIINKLGRSILYRISKRTLDKIDNDEAFKQYTKRILFLSEETYQHLNDELLKHLGVIYNFRIKFEMLMILSTNDVSKFSEQFNLYCMTDSAAAAFDYERLRLLQLYYMPQYHEKTGNVVSSGAELTCLPLDRKIDDNYDWLVYASKLYPSIGIYANLNYNRRIGIYANLNYNRRLDQSATNSRERNIVLLLKEITDIINHWTIDDFIEYDHHHIHYKESIGIFKPFYSPWMRGDDVGYYLDALDKLVGCHVNQDIIEIFNALIQKKLLMPYQFCQLVGNHGPHFEKDKLERTISYFEKILPNCIDHSEYLFLDLYRCDKPLSAATCQLIKTLVCLSVDGGQVASILSKRDNDDVFIPKLKGLITLIQMNLRIRHVAPDMFDILNENKQEDLQRISSLFSIYANQSNQWEKDFKTSFVKFLEIKTSAISLASECPDGSDLSRSSANLSDSQERDDSSLDPSCSVTPQKEQKEPEKKGLLFYLNTTIQALMTSFQK